MKTNPILPIRLKAGSPGLGEATQADIDRRAAELALSDGRSSYTDADLAHAAAELGGGDKTPPAPELEPGLEEVTAWDDPPAQEGHRIEPTLLEDEGSIAEQLISDGIEEADHDIRAAAEDGDDR